MMLVSSSGCAHSPMTSIFVARSALYADAGAVRPIMTAATVASTNPKPFTAASLSDRTSSRSFAQREPDSTLRLKLRSVKQVVRAVTISDSSELIRDAELLAQRRELLAQLRDLAAQRADLGLEPVEAASRGAAAARARRGDQRLGRRLDDRRRVLRVLGEPVHVALLLLPRPAREPQHELALDQRGRARPAPPRGRRSPASAPCAA